MTVKTHGLTIMLDYFWHVGEAIDQQDGLLNRDLICVFTRAHQIGNRFVGNLQERQRYRSRLILHLKFVYPEL